MNEVFNVQVFETKNDYQFPDSKPVIEKNFTNEEDADEFLANLDEEQYEFAYYGMYIVSNGVFDYEFKNDYVVSF